jgi:hypothetical protein
MHCSSIQSRTARALVLVSCCAALLPSASGCSFALVKPLPAAPSVAEGPGAPPAPAPRCTESRAAPVTDTVVGGVLLATAVAALAASSKSCDPGGLGCIGKGMALAVGVTTGLPSLGFLGSATYGYSKVSQCRAARRPVALRPCDLGDPACARVSWAPPMAGPVVEAAPGWGGAARIGP